jgi:hypothetical protein
MFMDTQVVELRVDGNLFNLTGPLTSQRGVPQVKFHTGEATQHVEFSRCRLPNPKKQNKVVRARLGEGERQSRQAATHYITSVGAKAERHVCFLLLS